ncbi:unnamed protein product [Adineta steineri]|uniref:Tetratricopeptide repeat protein n=1 Tax=Adineta steineri TaxID=433720 RepID=A0A814I3I9_9BILA|nr:unnamed protein product [Adineta steineri]CAF3923672.1 unnamed protein product [Adineta steineri]
MTEKKSTTANNSVNQSKPIAVKQEAPLLIWYNKNNDEKNQAEGIFSYFNNSQECIQTIEQSTKSIFLILNSSSATDILSRTHSLKQIDIIFIHCQSSREQQRCQYLLEHYSKIFDLFLDRQLLLNTIQENVIFYQHQSGNEYLRSAERYKQQNQLNHALKYTHKALDSYRKTLPNQNHPLIARCLNNLGTIYDAQGDVNRSFEYYEQAVKMYTSISPALSKQSVPNLLKK